MSIVTRTGDAGTTAVLYHRRVSKCHPQVEACGTVDEVTSALGLARALTGEDFVREPLGAVQHDLISLMGELAVLPEDRERFLKDGFKPVTADMIAPLDELVRAIEAQSVTFCGWATPGATPAAAALDVARSTCRRAERRVCALHDAGQLPNPLILVYLNRLSDALWLLARWVENRSTEAAPGPDV